MKKCFLSVLQVRRKASTVRISEVKSIFAKGYLLSWTEEIFTVAVINRKTSPLTSKLKDYNGEVAEGSFYREQIEHVILEMRSTL